MWILTVHIPSEAMCGHGLFIFQEKQCVDINCSYSKRSNVWILTVHIPSEAMCGH